MQLRCDGRKSRRFGTAPRDAPMHVIEGEPRHVDPVWTIIQRCREALAAEGMRQWNDIYPTGDVVAADIGRRGLFVLEDGERCLGSVAVDETQAPEYRSALWAGVEPALVVHRLCVEPAAQGRGFAHRLM